MPSAIVLRDHGGPDVLVAEDVEVADAGPGELRLRQTCVGVNFHDVYVRSGLYRTLPLPGIPGIEAVGVVEQVGAGVEGVAVGDRVGYITSAYGAYAAARVLPAALAVPLPDAVDDVTAAATLLKGLTVVALTRRVHALRAGERVLVHAAAGGVGQLLVQAALAAGAEVIATVGSPAKVEIVRGLGCPHVIDYRQEPFRDRVLELTGGRGVDVVYDSVGRDTFDGSLDVLATLGHLVVFGQASGPIEPLALARLAARSLTVSRPMVFHYAADRAALLELGAALFAAVADGTLVPTAPQRFALADAPSAHALLESRASASPLVLVP